MKDTMLSPPFLPDETGPNANWFLEAASLLNKAGSHHDQGAIAQLAAIIATSPHLHLLANKHTPDLPAALSGDISPNLEDCKQSYLSALSQTATDTQIMTAIRQLRTRHNFNLAIAEACGRLSIQAQMKALSDIAAFAIQHLVTLLCQKYGLNEDHFVVLAMGKLGAEELNYSSDVDLIFLYQSTALDQAVMAQSYVKMCRQMVQFLQTQTKDGFGWRVDLRLRPDAGATAICLSVEAAISYYESLARSWERAIYLRARPIAGNRTLGDDFLTAITPFIWRRQLDYSLLQDMTSWVTHSPMGPSAFGFDVKKGAYGIRHIEMMTHLLQLLHGGKDTSLRTHRTDDALRALAKAGHLTQDQAEMSLSAYYQWRQIEHRIQYIRDAQSYSLPLNEEEMQKFAHFTGMTDSQTLLAHITDLQNQTKQFANHPVITDLIAAHQGALQSGAWPAEDSAQHAYLEEKGFERAEDIMRVIASWMAGRIPATRSQRARDELQSLLPLICDHVAKGHAPDDHFMALAGLVEALPAGVSFFSLLNHHPSLIELISHLALTAPDLIQDLSKNPVIFEQMLDESFFAPLTDHVDFSDEIAKQIKGKAVETQLDIIRRFARECRFRAEVHILTISATPDTAHHYLSQLADSCLAATLQIAKTEFEAQHGTIDNSSFAIILVGRAGERQLTTASDIDLVFLYDGDWHSQSDGPRPLSLAHYYQRLTQKFISWTTARTQEGVLFQLDTRLRPDGSSGPIASHISSWQSYVTDKAWPFEILAYHKARLLDLDLISGEAKPTSALYDGILSNLSEIKNAAIDKAALANDAQLLRTRLADHAYGLWEMKKRPGGLIDCGFCQALLEDTEQANSNITTMMAHYQHLSMLVAIMKFPTSEAVPPAFFQKALCDAMGETDYQAAYEIYCEKQQAVKTLTDQLIARYLTQ